MKMEEAQKIINAKKPIGFLVYFERRMGGGFTTDHFPDFHGGEDPIETENEAWELAKKFADSTPSDICNIYVIDSTFRRVDEERCLKRSDHRRNYRETWPMNI